MKPLPFALLIVTVGMLAACSNLKLQWSASYMTDNLAADLRQAQQSSRPASEPVTKQEVPTATTIDGEKK